MRLLHALTAVVNAAIDFIYPRAGEPDKDGMPVKLLVLAIIAVGLVLLFLADK